jgi:hypothetical protein
VQIVIAQQDLEKQVERFEVALIGDIGIALILMDVTFCFEQRAIRRAFSTFNTPYNVSIANNVSSEMA